VSALIVAVMVLCSNRDATAHGDVHESIVAVTAEIEKNPQQADLFVRRASLHRAHQDWALALADLEQAQKLDPAQTVLDLSRGELLTELGKFSEAEVLLARFRDAFPQSPRGWAALGRLNAQQLRWDAAAADYGKAVELTQPPDPHLYLSQVEALRGAGKLEDASKVLDGGIAALGNLPSLVQPAVDVAIERKAWDRAVQLLDAAAAASVRKERWLMKKGEVLEKAGKSTEALETFRRALAEFETLPPNRRGVAAMIAFEQGLRTSIERVEQGAGAPAPPEPK
jgi:predicted Zn-dependent protease